MKIINRINRKNRKKGNNKKQELYICINRFIHKKKLRKVGLDLKFLLEDLFLENIKETVLTHEKKIGVKVDKLAQNDDFSTVSSQNLGSDVKVTSSVVSFYNLLVKFVNEICLLAKLPVSELFF